MFLGSLSKEPIQEGYQIVYSCEEVGEYSESIKETIYLILSEKKNRFKTSYMEIYGFHWTGRL